MDDGSSIFMITALIVLIMLSAFFSASETAYSSLNMIRLKSRAEAVIPFSQGQNLGCLLIAILRAAF